MNKPWWQSTTILGAILAGAAHVVMADPSQRLQAAAESVGGVMAAWGARKAIAVNGEGK